MERKEVETSEKRQIEEIEETQQETEGVRCQFSCSSGCVGFVLLTEHTLLY